MAELSNREKKLLAELEVAQEAAESEPKSEVKMPKEKMEMPLGMDLEEEEE